MKCPLCNEEMELKAYEGVEIDVCSKCEGVWLDKDELVKIVVAEEVEFGPSQVKDAIKDTAKEKSDREELMKYVMSFKKDVDLDKLNPEQILDAFKKRWGGTSTREMKCPKCANPLEEFEYAGTGVMLDRCSEHGFWLDAGELQKLQIMMEYYKGKFTSSAAGAQENVTDKDCPCCHVKLYEKQYEGVPIDVCSKCAGVWLDGDELYQIIQKREVKFSEQEKQEVNPQVSQQAAQTELVNEIKCCVCKAVMNRFTYAGTSGIIIDRCPQKHGVWLDKGELEKIQIYIEKSEEIGKENRDKYKAILAQARIESEKRQGEMFKDAKVSRFGAVNRLMGWIARKLD